MKTLKDVPVGQSARVLKVGGEGPLRRRILDMGITKGVSLYVRKLFPGQVVVLNSPQPVLPVIVHRYTYYSKPFVFVLIKCF